MNHTTTCHQHQPIEALYKDMLQSLPPATCCNCCIVPLHLCSAVDLWTSFRSRLRNGVSLFVSNFSAPIHKPDTSVGLPDPISQ